MIETILTVATGRIGRTEYKVVRTHKTKRQTVKYDLYVEDWHMGQFKTLSDALRWLADAYSTK